MHCAPRDVALVLISGAGLALTAEGRERACLCWWAGFARMSERLQGGLKDRWEGMRSFCLERWLELVSVVGSLTDEIDVWVYAF